MTAPDRRRIATRTLENAGAFPSDACGARHPPGTAPTARASWNQSSSRVRTVVVSDLHIGSVKHADLLRRPELRAPLIEAVRDADRLVILGDGVELRDRPKRDIAELAGPVFRELGEALGPRGELVLVAGNHDHGLVAGWIDGRLETEPSGFLGLEQYLEPAEAGPLAATLAAHAGPGRVRVAYPGLWLRDDVYAIHGH